MWLLKKFKSGNADNDQRAACSSQNLHVYEPRVKWYSRAGAAACGHVSRVVDRPQAWDRPTESEGTHSSVASLASYARGQRS